MSDDRYLTVAGTIRARFTVAGSRFIGTLAPAAGEEEARRVVEEVVAEFADATHNAFAFRIGAGPALLERASDAREPAGSAGPPMLQALRKAAVSDAVVVGTRYFGGVKLGFGGLVRAYGRCASLCLEQAELVEKVRRVYRRITIDYGELGIATRHIETLGGEIIKVDYTGAVTLAAAIPPSAASALEEGLADLTRGRARCEALKRPEV